MASVPNSVNSSGNLVGGISNNFKTKDEMAKLKALDEARKAGTAPPLVDEEGEAINPHIPQYMMQVPFYMNDGAPTLKHQKYDNFIRPKADGLDKYYKKGEVKEEKKPEKFRPGACKNCGAMTHKTKDCTERRRRRGAALTGTNLAADEHQLEDINFSFEGKRDRWNGYDASIWKNEVLANHQEMEAERKKIRDQKMKEKILKKQQKEKEKASKKRKREDGKSTDEKDPKKPRKEGENPDNKESDSSSSDSDDDELKDDDDNEDKLHDSKAKLQQYMGASNRSTVRDLRIREDTAKYLLNLDENSAFYDPKSRSMRENPKPEQGIDGGFESGGIQTSSSTGAVAPTSSGTIATSIFKGDAALSTSGQFVEVMKMTKFAMEAEKVNATAGEGKKGVVSAVATPSQTELMYKQFLEKKEEMKKDKQKKIVQKYGGEDFLLDPEM